MSLFIKRRIFRSYLRLRERADQRATRTFAGLARLVTGIKIPPEEVRRGMYRRSGRPGGLHITGKNVKPETVTLAKELFEESRSRISTVASKVGTLLTVTSIAVSGTLTSLSLIGFPSNLAFFAAFLVTIVVFISTGWFLFKFLAVGQISAPNIDQEFLDLTPEMTKAAYVRDLLAAADQNDLRNNFLVDIYRAGRRLCALSFACALGLVVFAVADRIGREDRVIQKLRSDPQLLNLLRGPQGPPGTPGTAGSRGEKGERGDRGSAYLPNLPVDLFGSEVLHPIRLELSDPSRKVQSPAPVGHDNNAAPVTEASPQSSIAPLGVK